MKKLHILCVSIVVMASAFLGAVTTGCSDEPKVAPFYNEQDSLALCAIMAAAPHPSNSMNYWETGNVHTLPKDFNVVWEAVEGESAQRITRLEMMAYSDDYNMDGTISDAIGELTGLTHLVISGNRWAGAMPNSMKNLKNLRELQISQTNLQSLPDSLNLRNCTRLVITYNHFTSLFKGIEEIGEDVSFPLLFSNIQVNINYNEITGRIPILYSRTYTNADFSNNYFTSVDYSTIFTYVSFNANLNEIRNDLPMLAPYDMKKLFLAVGRQRYGWIPGFNEDSMWE